MAQDPLSEPYLVTYISIFSWCIKCASHVQFIRLLSVFHSLMGGARGLQVCLRLLNALPKLENWITVVTMYFSALP